MRGWRRRPRRPDQPHGGRAIRRRSALRAVANGPAADNGNRPFNAVVDVRCAPAARRQVGYDPGVDGNALLFIVLKIPIVALGWLVWWALHQEPEPEEAPPGDGGQRVTGLREPVHPRKPLPRAAPPRAARRRGPASPPRVRPVVTPARATAAAVTPERRPGVADSAVADPAPSPCSPTARSAASSRRGRSPSTRGTPRWSSPRRSTCGWVTRSGSSTTIASTAIDLREPPTNLTEEVVVGRGRAVRHPPGRVRARPHPRAGAHARRHRGAHRGQVEPRPARADRPRHRRLRATPARRAR